MNRRGFLSLLGLGVGGLAIDQAIPLGRVWSFPSKIALAKHPFDFGEHMRSALTRYHQELDKWNSENIDAIWSKSVRIGTTLRVRIPQRFIVRDYIGDFSKPPQWCDEIYWGRPPG